MTYWVGLTGGVAAGKSTVSKLFENLGVTVLDADDIAKELCEPGQAGLKALMHLLADQMPFTADQRLDRKALRKKLFEDKAIKAKVETALHPLIHDVIFGRAGEAKSAYVVLSIPLLVEKGWHKEVNRVLVVDVPESVQIERLKSRDGISIDEAEKMLANQASRQERLAAATDVLDNTRSLDTLAAEIKKLHAHFLEMAFNKAV